MCIHIYIYIEREREREREREKEREREIYSYVDIHPCMYRHMQLHMVIHGWMELKMEGRKDGSRKVQDVAGPDFPLSKARDRFRL